MSAIIPTYSSPYGAVGTYGGSYGAPAVAYGGSMGGSMALFRERSMAIPMSQPLSIGSSALGMPAAYPSMPVVPSYGGVTPVGYGGGYTQIRDPLSKKYEKDGIEYQKDLLKCRDAEIKAEKSRAEAMVAAAVYKEKLLNADKAMMDLAGVRSDMADKAEKKATEGFKLDDK
jgi:hypothetical protein